MDYQLVIVRGRGAAEAIKLVDGVTTVGRHDDCQLRIKSSQVSRRHCEIFEKKGLLLVKDLGSSNGTYVNGKRIEEQRVLEPGDELTIGQVKLRVAKLGEVSASAAPRPQSAPGDTAVVEAIAGSGGEDDFEIEFDDEPEAVTAAPAPKEPAAPAAVEAAAPAESASKPQPEPQDAMAEDAIADFLLDIKLDEEE